MGEIFKNIIEEHFYQEILNSLRDEIMNNYCHYDLTIRANVVQEVLEASLKNMDIMRVYNINQDDEEICFNALVSCSIEIGDYVYGENVSESVCQWFELSCSAILENTELKDFSVDEIKAYNKQRGLSAYESK
ncbi:MAG: hypothetical protein ACERLG_07805 [Sedimentibacter sp.]